MMRLSSVLLAAFAALSATPSLAELPVGSRVPMFATASADAGKPARFSLAVALKRGPVVIYFYPKAFTPGCTLEAHAFAEANDDFAAAGATVIGLSADDLPTLQRFSVEECRSKFPVGIATPAIIDAFDVALGKSGLTSRTSYVIAPNGKVAFVYSDRNYREHVGRTLAAVRALKRRKH